jgi:hypothetical protein
MHFGGEVVRLSNHITNTFRMDGNFTFNGQLSGDGIADFLLGRASGFVQGGGEFKDLKGTRWGFFAQDNWRVNQSLTLNLGVRWDPYFPYYDREGRVVCFEPGANRSATRMRPPACCTEARITIPDARSAGRTRTSGTLPRGRFRLPSDRRREDEPPRWIRPLLHTLSRRAPSTRLRTSRRSPRDSRSTAWSFEDPFGSVGVTNPFPEQFGPRVPGPEATFVTPTELRAVFARDFRTPLLASWNLSLERQIGADWVLRVTYAGNKGSYYFGAAENSREINPAIYVPGASTVANTQARRPYQDYSRIGLYESTNESEYNSVQLNAEKRFGKGLAVLASYTFSRKLDDYGWTTPDDRRFDWGLSREDVPHNFKFSNVWQIPHMGVNGVLSAILNGWMVNSMVTWQSGFPLTISSGRDNSFTGINRDRADFLGGSADLGSDRPHAEMVAKYFDTSKFVANAIGTFGNSEKNMLRGPGTSTRTSRC